MMNDDVAEPGRIKEKIQGAYARAVSNRSMQISWSSSGIDLMLRNLTLYGQDAGVDFVDTRLEAIVQEAEHAAECKQRSLVIQTQGFGQAAIAGMISRLRELTALKVEGSASTIRLIWAEDNPGLV